MKYIKLFEDFSKNEGFLEFFKKKQTSDTPVYLEDIKECGYDLYQLPGIRSKMKGDAVDGIFHALEDIGHSAHPERVFIDRIQINVFGNRSQTIIDKPVLLDALKDFEEKLKTYDCKMCFFLAWGHDEGRTDDKEYKSVDNLVDRIYEVRSNPNITIKISSPSDIIVD